MYAKKLMCDERGTHAAGMREADVVGPGGHRVTGQDTTAAATCVSLFKHPVLHTTKHVLARQHYTEYNSIYFR